MAETTKTRRHMIAGCGVFALAVWGLGSYHFVWGTLDRPHLERKVSWSLSETFINTDEITGVPTDAMRAQRWPLYFQSLKAGQKR